MSFLILYCGLSLLNVVIQTIKSICTIKCSTFISACVNAVAYGLYVYVIFFTNAEGLALWGKAIITACANFTGVYIANFLFNKLFHNEVLWKIDVALPAHYKDKFEQNLDKYNLGFYAISSNDNWINYSVFCPTSKDSENLKAILPEQAKYGITECAKKL